MVELFPHGNMTVCDGIIEALVSGGARIAERGEFTKRAFLNGKLDLMQCEALADINRLLLRQERRRHHSTVARRSHFLPARRCNAELLLRC